MNCLLGIYVCNGWRSCTTKQETFCFWKTIHNEKKVAVEYEKKNTHNKVALNRPCNEHISYIYCSIGVHLKRLNEWAIERTSVCILGRDSFFFLLFNWGASLLSFQLWVSQCTPHKKHNPFDWIHIFEWTNEQNVIIKTTISMCIWQAMGQPKQHTKQPLHTNTPNRLEITFTLAKQQRTQIEKNKHFIHTHSEFVRVEWDFGFGETKNYRMYMASDDSVSEWAYVCELEHNHMIFW